MPNKKTVVRTNSTPNSIKEVPLKAVTFQELWDAYPSGNPYNNPEYGNQCAIRMSVMFHRVGVEMKSFSQKLVRPLSGSECAGARVFGSHAAENGVQGGRGDRLNESAPSKGADARLEAYPIPRTER